MSDPAAVRAHLNRILSSPGFANAERLRRFLSFTVNAHLNGEAGQIKELVLGHEVFDRDASYDPRLDPIVRVEARRLRQRLAEYYAGPGASEPFRIDFPKGAYAPVIAPMPKNTTSHGRLLLAVTLIAVAFAAWYFTRTSVPANTLAIVPARWTFVDPAGLHPADEALCEAITAQVANRGRVPVVGWPSILPFRQRHKQSPDVAKDTGASMVLAIAVRETAPRFRVTAFLVEPFTGRKRWAEDFYSQDLQSPDSLRALAQTIAHDLEIALGTGN